MKAFDFIDNILSSREHKFQEAEKYSQFLVNRGLSYHYDTAMLAQVANERSMDDDLHYEFLFNSTPKKRRKFQKWSKVEEDEDLLLIQEAYGCNLKTAIQYLSVLNTDDMVKLRECLYKGGKDAR